jgi:hypothetical protein
MLANTQVTRQQVEEVMGRLDGLKLAEILEAGASPVELLEAKRWLVGDAKTVAEDSPIRPSIVQRLCDILRADEPDWYD